MAGERHKDELSDDQLDGITGGSSGVTPTKRSSKSVPDDPVPAPQDGPKDDRSSRPKGSEDLIKPF